MGATGLYVPRPGSAGAAEIAREPLSGSLGDFENRFRRGNDETTRIEHAALFSDNGEPIVGYQGDRHSVPLDQRVLNNPGATLSHFHPDTAFGGTLSMQDLKLFAKSQLGEMRAVSRQGQLYSIKANADVDRKALDKWVKRVEPIAKKNFRNSYDRARKAAQTPLKSGPHKGMVKLTNPSTGKSVYREPMTNKQAMNYARQYSVGAFERMYKKNLAKFGVTYTSTKGGYARQSFK